MIELWEFANKIPGAPVAAVLAFLLLVIVITGRRGDWVWKRELDALSVQLAKSESEAGFWKDMYLRRVGVVEDAVDLAKQRRS
jgi:hypothetical protein